MMDELSYVYDEENRETLYKTMIDKMYANMSDRSSIKNNLTRIKTNTEKKFWTLAVD